MNAGPLRHRVKIQAKTLTTDSYGGPVETWADFDTVWANIEPLQGNELVKAQAVRTETTHRITMRYLSGVTPAHRITYAGRYFNLLSVIDPELRGRELLIMASEGLNEG